ncbi:MAG: hypothetical protein AAF821_23640 [Cyanobacteria bacterium P01_D01_bin.156]
MRLPPSIRYLPSRLQVLFNPWLWLGVLLTGVVGIYAWEYRQNPGQVPWRLSTTEQDSDTGSSTDVLLESLTPEERAVAVELDNIELLLNELDAEVSALTSGGESSAAASLNAALADAPDAPENTAAISAARLNQYVNEYSFVGTRARGVTIAPTSQDSQTDESGQQEQNSVLRFAPYRIEGQTVNPLSQAFFNQRPESPLNPGSSNRNASGVEGSDVTSEPAFSFEQSDIVPGSVDGLNRTFIRTTPSMSPPPGTTGYVPPASLPITEPAIPQSGLAPFSPTVPSFTPSAPAVSLPDRSQVLPPAADSVVTPLEIPTVDGSRQVTPQQLRNAWESFFD